MRWMTWELGRRGKGYFRFLLFESRRLHLDMKLFRLPLGATIEPVADRVGVMYKGYALAFVLKKAQAGGVLLTASPLWRWWRFTYFRPDRGVYNVSPVVMGTSYILMLRWLRRRHDPLFKPIRR